MNSLLLIDLDNNMLGDSLERGKFSNLNCNPLLVDLRQLCWSTSDSLNLWLGASPTCLEWMSHLLLLLLQLLLSRYKRGVPYQKANLSAGMSNLAAATQASFRPARQKLDPMILHKYSADRKTPSTKK